MLLVFATVSNAEFCWYRLLRSVHIGSGMGAYLAGYEWYHSSGMDEAEMRFIVSTTQGVIIAGSDSRSTKKLKKKCRGL